MQLPLTAKQLSPTEFDILLHDGSRTYHWFDDLNRGEVVDAWVGAINCVSAAWEAYMRRNFNYQNSPQHCILPPPPPPSDPTLCLIL